MKRNIFIGGAWPYANSSLHIGHIAALLPGDIIARYYRKKGDDVLYVSGTDSHGTPVILRSLSEKLDPNEVAEKYHLQIKNCFERLNFSYDIYSSTCEISHQDEVQDFVKQFNSNGFLYDSEDYQEYCEHCNKFLSDREIIGNCPVCGGYAKGDQCEVCSIIYDARHLKNKHCKYCGSPVSYRKNKNLYWRLSYFKDSIIKYVNSNTNTWKPTVVKKANECITLALQDKNISRELPWGINIPLSGYSNKTVYVWIDALMAYITAGKKYCQEHNLDWEKFYKDSSNLRSYFVHGKDNIPFHALIYPGLLLSLNSDFKLPDYFVASDFLFVNNEKISKTKGNGVMAIDLISKYDSDSIRFYMACKAPESEVSHFTFSDFEDCHNKYLVNSYNWFVTEISNTLLKDSNGMFINRSNCNEKIELRIRKTYTKVGNLIENGEIRAAIHEIKDLMTFSRDFWTSVSSWISTEYELASIEETKSTCFALLVNLANLLDPFMPISSEMIFKSFGLKNSNWGYISVKDFKKLNKLPNLFNTIY